MRRGGCVSDRIYSGVIPKHLDFRSERMGLSVPSPRNQLSSPKGTSTGPERILREDQKILSLGILIISFRVNEICKESKEKKKKTNNVRIGRIH